VRDALGPVTTLVELAVGTDDSARLLAAAFRELEQPLGLVDPSGEPLGSAPQDDEGGRALAVATAAARNRLVAPPGWHIAALTHDATPLGFLAAGMEEGGDARSRRLVDLVAALVSDQLQRVALLRSQRAALVRRLVSDRQAIVGDLRHQAAELGLRLASAYWPGMLVWRNVPPPGSVVEAVAREARTRVAGSLAVAFDGRLVLLHPAEAQAAGAVPPRAWFAELARLARGLAPSSRAQAIVADAPSTPAALSRRVAALDELVRFGPRADEHQLAVRASQFALDRLLCHDLDRAAAEHFVQGRLGSLIASDSRHQRGLAVVLEAALDFPRADQAARKCFMHRNTFRHRLRQAAEALGDDLDDPDVRIAVHVALKLRKVLAAQPRA
jgi:sugar diacid utilization regulator